MRICFLRLNRLLGGIGTWTPQDPDLEVIPGDQHPPAGALNVGPWTKAIHERIFVDMFRRPSILSVERASEAGPGGWLYRFHLPSTRKHNGKYVGATHACEMAFTFNAFADPDCKVFAFHDRKDPVAHKLAEQWSNTLIAFARTGDPNGAVHSHGGVYGPSQPGCRPPGGADPALCS